MKKIKDILVTRITGEKIKDLKAKGNIEMKEYPSKKMTKYKKGEKTKRKNKEKMKDEAGQEMKEKTIAKREMIGEEIVNKENTKEIKNQVMNQEDGTMRIAIITEDNKKGDRKT